MVFCLERGVKEPPDEVEALDADNMAEVSPWNDRRPRGPGMERGGWRVGCLSASGAMDCRRRWYVGVSPAATGDVLDRPRNTATAAEARGGDGVYFQSARLLGRVVRSSGRDDVGRTRERDKKGSKGERERERGRDGRRKMGRSIEVNSR